MTEDKALGAPLLVDLLHRASLEISAGNAKAIAHVRENFDPGAEVFINFVPDGDARPIVETAIALRRAGFTPVPHLAARSIASQAALDDCLARLVGEAAADRVLLIAGDRARPAGPFSSSMDVFATGAIERAGIRAVGFAGHPEGHPRVDTATLEAALLAKRDAARAAGLGLFVVTQFAFEAAPVLAWLERTRALGLDAPIRIGVAGPASVATLVRFGIRCGIGASLNAVRLNPHTVGRLLGAAGPEALLAELAAGLARAGETRVGNIHFFPFGGIVETGDFIVALLAQLYREVAPGRAATA